MLDSGPPTVDLAAYVRNESRYRVVEQAMPERFKTLLAQAREQVARQQALYSELAGKTGDGGAG